MTHPLKERLVACDTKWLGSAGIAPLFNPDGPEALARIEVLEKALRPFAAWETWYDGTFEEARAPDDLMLFIGPADTKSPLRVGHLRVARSALNEGG